MYINDEISARAVQNMYEYSALWPSSQSGLVGATPSRAF